MDSLPLNPPLSLLGLDGHRGTLHWKYSGLSRHFWVQLLTCLPVLQRMTTDTRHARRPPQTDCLIVFRNVNCETADTDLVRRFTMSPIASLIGPRVVGLVALALAALVAMVARISAGSSATALAGIDLDKSEPDRMFLDMPWGGSPVVSSEVGAQPQAVGDPETMNPVYGTCLMPGVAPSECTPDCAFQCDTPECSLNCFCGCDSEAKARQVQMLAQLEHSVRVRDARQALGFYDVPKWPSTGPTGNYIDHTAPLNTDSTGVDQPIKQGVERGRQAGARERQVNAVRGLGVKWRPESDQMGDNPGRRRWDAHESARTQDAFSAQRLMLGRMQRVNW